MSFLIEATDEEIVDGTVYLQYVAYLKSVREQLPPAAYAFAIADWHYDFRNPKCLHDAWIQEIKIKEIAEGERAEIRKTQIEILLLGAYHDRMQLLIYTDVAAYSVTSPQSQHGHEDWLIDEVSLSKSGLVIHKVKLRSGASLKIESRDISIEEQLTSDPYHARWSS